MLKFYVSARFMRRTKEQIDMKIEEKGTCDKNDFFKVIIC